MSCMSGPLTHPQRYQSAIIMQPSGRQAASANENRIASHTCTYVELEWVRGWCIQTYKRICPWHCLVCKQSCTYAQPLSGWSLTTRDSKYLNNKWYRCEANSGRKIKSSRFSDRHFNSRVVNEHTRGLGDPFNGQPWDEMRWDEIKSKQEAYYSL